MSREYDPFKCETKRILNKFFKEVGEDRIVSMDALASFVMQSVMKGDKRIYNLLTSMVKDVIREDNDYMIVRGKAGGVRKTSKSRKKKVKLVSCDGTRESFLTAQAEAFVGGMSDE